MCGAKEGGLSLDGVNVAKEAVIQGQVLRAGDGEWTLRTLAPKAQPVDTRVVAATGSVAEVQVLVSA